MALPPSERSNRSKVDAAGADRDQHRLRDFPIAGGWICRDIDPAAIPVNS